LNTGGGTDQLYFGSNDGGLTEGQVAQIKFENPAGYAPGVYDAMILPSGEVVPIPLPVPEPKTVAAVAFLAVFIGFRERKRLCSLLRMLRSAEG
jgi:hypothetical protein